MTIIHCATVSSIVTATELAASSRIAKNVRHITSASFGRNGGRVRYSDDSIEGVRFAPAKRDIHVVHGSPQGVRAVGEITPGLPTYAPDAHSRAWAKRHERRATRRALKNQLRAEMA
jgi:hypothetical protein